MHAAASKFSRHLRALPSSHLLLDTVSIFCMHVLQGQHCPDCPAVPSNPFTLLVAFRAASTLQSHLALGSFHVILLLQGMATALPSVPRPLGKPGV